MRDSRVFGEVGNANSLGFGPISHPSSDILGYFATLPPSVRPEVESVAADCLVPDVNRLKIYVRTRSTRFTDLEGLMTLGGSLNGQVVNNGMEVRRSLSNIYLGI